MHDVSLLIISTKV